MKRNELIETINNNNDIDYGVCENEISFLGTKIFGLTFYLRNNNKDKAINNPYKCAIDLTKM